jgi:hypothetical protein
MTTHDDKELAAIAAELEALGEPLPEELAAELAEASLVSEVLVAASDGKDAVASLPDDAAPQALQTLHLLRGAAGADGLGEFAQRRGLQRVHEQLARAQAPGTGSVIPLWRRRSVQVFLAAAAMVAFVVAALWLQPAPVPGPSPIVAQAEQRASDLERMALQQLMSGTAQATPGDHGLRELREARYDVVAARAQARARRL